MCRPFCSWVSLFPALFIFCFAIIANDQTPDTYFRILLGALVAVNLQHACNIADDLNSYLTGVDKYRPNTKPGHMVNSGEVSIQKAKQYLILTFIAAAFFGLLAVILTPAPIFEKLIILVFGLITFLAAYFYSDKKVNYAKRGLGEIVSFLFFGPIEVIGLMWLFLGSKLFENSQAIYVSLYLGVFFGIPVLFLMSINNIRDIDDDLKVGKKTLPARIGFKKSIILFSVLLFLHIILSDPFLFLNFVVGMQVILVLIPQIVIGVVMIKNLKEHEYLKTLTNLGFYALVAIISLFVEYTIAIFISW